MSLKPYLVHHLLEESAQRFPDKVAVKDKGRTISFESLCDDAFRMKELLLECGMEIGERVGILLDKSIEQLTVMYGCSMAGAVFVFINPILKKRQIEYIAEDCQIRVLVTSRRLYQKSGALVNSRIVYMEGLETGEDAVSWEGRKDSLEGRHTAVARIADDVACLIYTSGSTGMPKGVVVPHRTVVEGAEIVSSYLELSEQDRLISVLPFNFDYGLNQATSACLKGASLVLHRFFLPTDLLKLIEKEEITGFAGMPPIWLKLFSDKFDVKTQYDFRSLRYITNSGGKVPRSVLSKMRAFFPGTRIFLMYGLTEAFRSTYLDPGELDGRPDSMGKAIPNVEILVVNSKGEVCAPGEPGELVHRGALITRGYWNDPERTRRVFRRNPMFGAQEHLNEVVVYSGDLVKRDEEGFLYFISRRDEMIKTSGYRVSPTEIEEVLIEMAGIRNAVVFGREVENTEQIIVAVIEADGSSVDERGMLQECRKRLPPYLVPREVHFETSFKKTANGKIDRSFIKKKYLSTDKEDEAQGT